MFVLKGPGIRQDQLLYGSSVLDITPTLLHLGGRPFGRDMDGKVLQAAFVDPREPEWIDSWDDVPGPDGTHPLDRRFDPLSVPITSDDTGSTAAQQGILSARRARNEWLYNQALSLIADRREVRAIRVLETAWAEDPEESRYAYHLMMAYMAVQRPADARKSLERLLQNKKRAAPAALAEWTALEAPNPESLGPLERVEKLRLWKLSRSNLTGMGYLQVCEVIDEQKVYNKAGLRKLKADGLYQLKRMDEAKAVYREQLEQAEGRKEGLDD